MQWIHANILWVPYIYVVSIVILPSSWKHCQQQAAVRDAAGGGVFFVAVAAFGAADAAGGGVFFLAVFSFVFTITFSNRPKSSWHLATLDFFFGEAPPRPRRFFLRDSVVGSPTYIYIYIYIYMHATIYKLIQCKNYI